MAREDGIGKGSKKETAKVTTPQKQQLWGDRLTEAPEMRNIAYCAGRDVSARPMADAVMIPFDIWQNRAHVAMLARQHIISPAEASSIAEALKKFSDLCESGEYTLNPDKEDVHTNIEHFVSEQLGRDIAGKIHTARSRNDQTTTVVRLFIRDRLLVFGTEVSALVSEILDAAEKYVEVPIAGFTHYQPASITTVGHWFLSYTQALLRDLRRLLETYDRINFSPLGAAASFGTSWPIDRKLTAKLLGFTDSQCNTLDCITNRWEMEAEAATVVSFIMTHLSIISQDLIVLSTPAHAILKIADRYVTGSSIMPQKRNPDFAEVTRAKAALIQNMMTSLFSIARGVLSGYNRDTQWTKYLVLDVFDEAMDAPAVFGGVFSTIEVDEKIARESAERDFVDAVDVADVLAQQSELPFRTTYEIASKAVKMSEDQGLSHIDLKIVEKLAAEAGARNVRLSGGTPMDIVMRKAHPGGPAPASTRKNVREQRAAHGKYSQALRERRTRLEIARKELDDIESRR